MYTVGMIRNERTHMNKTFVDVVDGQYIGYVNGKVVCKTSSKYYCQKKVDAMAGQMVAQEEVEERMSEEFPINQRFDFVTDLVTMVATKKTPSVIITGEGGLGKSYTVQKALDKAGLRDMSVVLAESDIGSVVMSENCYVVMKGYSTAKALYRTLYENRNSIIVFDDCDSILKDVDALNVLKGALDSFDRRIISWNSELRDDSIPRMFQFKGGIVFISNMKPEKLDQALRSRSMCVDLGMTSDQKLDRMEHILESGEFLESISFEYKREALQCIRENKDACKEISLRTLIQISKIRDNNTANWKELAKYMLVA